MVRGNFEGGSGERRGEFPGFFEGKLDAGRDLGIHFGVDFSYTVNVVGGDIGVGGAEVDLLADEGLERSKFGVLHDGLLLEGKEIVRA